MLTYFAQLGMRELGRSGAESLDDHCPFWMEMKEDTHFLKQRRPYVKRQSFMSFYIKRCLFTCFAKGNDVFLHKNMSFYIGRQDMTVMLR